MKKIIFVAVYLVGTYLHASCINVVPLSGGDNLAQYFDRHARDDCMRALCDLKAACAFFGHDMQATTIERAVYTAMRTLLFDTPYSFQADHDPSQWFLMLWEPPTVIMKTYMREYHRYFAKVFTLFDMLRGENYVKFYFPQPSLTMIDEVIPFEEKKLCALIACNKSSPHPLELYSQRARVIQYFEAQAPYEFDLYGIGWNAQQWTTYKGSIDHKVPTLKKYKFSFCYENMLNDGGYITEKIFDSMVAGCVPIYLGATNVRSYIPSTCFIAREKFHSLEELHAFLKNMTQEDYNVYLENIRTFLKSDEAFLFSIEFFVDMVLQFLIPDYDRTLLFTLEITQKILRCHKLYTSRHGVLQ